MSRFTTTPPATVHYTTCADSPAGKLIIGMTDKGELCRVGFVGKLSMRGILEAWQDEWPKTEFIKNAKPTTYVTLKKKPILMVGTPFQHKVWRTMLTIPAGKTLSYGQVAAQIKNPKAARAVGSACGRNPVPLIVPCHRILAANQKIGGFSSDPAIKVKLLTIEKAYYNT